MNRGGAPLMQRGLARLAVAIVVCYAAVALGLGYWQGLQAQALTDDPGNPLVAALRDGPRGRILDARGTVIAQDVTVGGVRVRRYPQPAAEPVVGYWSSTLGSSGLEHAYDADLSGLAGTSPVDELLRKFGASSATPLDVVTSLDMRLQADAVKLLGKQKGAIVALDPTTGRVLALASTPSFDPNQVVAPGTGTAYLAGLSAPGNASPLLDRATQGRYTPGSVFKMVTAVAGLGSGAITAATTYPDQPAEEHAGFVVDGFHVVDGHHDFTGDTALDFVQATEVSCNIYFAHVGPGDGRGRPARLGAAAGLRGAHPVRPPDGGEPGDLGRRSARRVRGRRGAGQRGVRPGHDGRHAAADGAGGGHDRRQRHADAPHPVDALRSPGGTVVQRTTPQVWRHVLSSAQDAVIQEAMTGAVESAWGQPFAGSAAIPGVPTAGKTGTAQLGGSGEPHAWFIGFAPAAAPRIAVAVIIEQGGHGGEVAAPLGGQLMGDWLRMAP